MRTVFRNSEIPGRIHALQPFLSTGRLPDGTRTRSGHSGPAVSLGYLPARLHASARSAVYVVYSYGTPIAWVTENDDEHGEPYTYHIPDVGYSLTTGQHQYDCLDAWKGAARRRAVDRHGRREVVRIPPTAEAYGVPRRPRSGGLDGFQPGSVVGARRSAYEGTGDDASHWSPSRKPGGPGYSHPAHP